MQRNIVLPDVLVLYDDQCGLCHKFVQFLLKVEKKDLIYYAPRHGETATLALMELNQEIGTIDSVLLIQRMKGKQKLFYYSDAALQTMKILGWPWKLFWCLSAIPRFIRDPIYRYLARNRYSLFGKTEKCLFDKYTDDKRMLP